jgi:ABC-type multidrug transport system fused ATPase/permease subunit
MSRAIGSCIDGDEERLRTSLELFAIAGGVNAALDFWNVFLFTFVQNRIVRRLRSTLFQKILGQEIGYFDVTSGGSISSRLTADTTEIASNLSWVFRNVTESVVRVSGIAVYLLLQNWRLGLVACAIVPITTAANRIYGEWMTKNATATQDSLAAANHVALEAIGAIRTVVSFANEKHECKRYDSALGRWYELCNRQAVVTGIYFSVIYSFLSQLVVPVALLVYGSHLVMSGQMHPERLIAFMLYQGQLQEYVSNLLNAFTSMYKSSGSAAAVFELIDRQPVGNNEGSHVVTPFLGAVELRDVHFFYPARPEKVVLNGVALRAEPGEFVALVGGSGSGKSTVFHLLQHFYEPQMGVVALDGVDVSLLSHAWLHKVMACVGQEPVLFSGTVLENITYSRRMADAERDEENRRRRARRKRASRNARVNPIPIPGGSGALLSLIPWRRTGGSFTSSHSSGFMSLDDLDEEEMRERGGSPGSPYGDMTARSEDETESLGGSGGEDSTAGIPEVVDGDVISAAMAANAHTFVTSMPRGFHTQVGERGVQLSGGQKQRIAIARAILCNPAVLLLDEATSALDAASEAQVQGALDNAMHGRTTLVIAHRLSTVKGADKIFVLHRGAVVEEGTHAQLISAHDDLQEPPIGSYAQLANLGPVRQVFQEEDLQGRFDD